MAVLSKHPTPFLEIQSAKTLIRYRVAVNERGQLDLLTKRPLGGWKLGKPAAKLLSLFERGGLQAVLDHCLQAVRDGRYLTGKNMLRVPSLESIRRWSFDSVVEAVCGCDVEPDGHCYTHNQPSWLIKLGMI